MIDLIATYAAMILVVAVPLVGIGVLIWYAHTQDREKRGPRYPK